MVARSLTVLAPVVSEFTKPIPITCFCGAMLLAFLVSLTHHGAETDRKLTAAAQLRSKGLNSGLKRQDDAEKMKDQ